MDFNTNQEKIVKTTAHHVVVHAAAGSGKTRCLVGRLKYLLDNGVAPEQIIAITFTNAAAEEIMERLNRPVGLFVGTIHSLANQFLISCGIKTFDLIEDENFDGLFSRIKEHPDCVRHVQYLLLDEAQDSSPTQFEFIFDNIKPDNWMIFADVRQSIYRWNGAYPEYIFDLMNENKTTIYDLNEYYRCGQKIIVFARQLIQPLGFNYTDRSKAMRDEQGAVLFVEFSPKAIAKTIKERIDKGIDKESDWFVLTRTNAESDVILEELKRVGVSCDSFKRKSLTNRDLQDKMKADTVKVLTIHVAKGLEAKNVVVIGGRFMNTEERCICYVAATRAKDLLVWTHEKKKFKRKGMVSWE